MTRMRSAAEGLALTIGSTVGPELRVLVQTFTEFLSILTETEEDTRALGTVFSAFVQGFTRGIIFILQGARAVALAINGWKKLFNETAQVMLGGVELILLANKKLAESVNFRGLYDDVIAESEGAISAIRGLTSGFVAEQAAIERSSTDLDIKMVKLIGRLEAVPAALAAQNARVEELAQKHKKAAEEAEALEDAMGAVYRRAVAFAELPDNFLEPLSLGVKTATQRWAEYKRAQEDALSGLAESVNPEESSQDPLVMLEEYIAGLTEQEQAEAAAADATLKAAQAKEKAIAVAKRFTDALVQNSAQILASASTGMEALTGLAKAALQAIGQVAIGKASEQLALAWAAVGSRGASGDAAGHFKSASLWFAAGALATAAAGSITTRKQQGGIVTGPGGSDSVTGFLTPGEGVLTVSQTQAVLGGGAVIVPTGAEEMDQGGGGADLSFLQDTIIDGNALRRVLSDNPEAVVGALRSARASGVG